MSHLRRTKIIATLGPATDDPGVLQNIIEKGVDLVRLNFSHGSAEEQKRRIDMVRAIGDKLDREIGVLADLQGPKIRIGKFIHDKVTLLDGQSFIIDGDLALDKGDEKAIGITYKALPQDLKVGDHLLLDDGRLAFSVDKINGNKIHCTVKVGGELSNNKGINRQGGGLSADALTDKDKADIKSISELDVDYVAVSFVRDGSDVEHARQLLREVGSQADIIAKIERREAIDVIDDIIEASDGVMVARGDLGVEIGDAELVAVQKYIITRARHMNKAVITATQMMESMISNTIPTRAEVSDVANAVLDYSDAVMLSAETAAGKHPVKVIETMARICLGAEQDPSTQLSRHRVDWEFKRVDEAIAMATMYTANHMGIKAIVALTESGRTPLWMSRIRSAIPVYALSRFKSTQRKVTLFRGIYPVNFDVTQCQDDEIDSLIAKQLCDSNIVQLTDTIIITRGDLLGIHGHTNRMRIIKVSELYEQAD